MPKTLQIQNVEKVKAEIQSYFSTNEDARFMRRLDIILLVCDDCSINHIANLFKINSTTIQRWIHRVNKFGLLSLKDNPDRGRRAKLSETEFILLKDEIIRSPKDIGYNQARWDGKLLSHHLDTRYGIKLKVRQCQNLFKKLGFSLKRPRRVPIGSNHKEREIFKKKSK